MAASEHGVFKLLATLVDGPTDEYLPQDRTDFVAKFPFLNGDEHFKERQRIPVERNVYEEQPAVWPSLSTKLHSAAKEFSKAHTIATLPELDKEIQSILRFSFDASPPSGQWTELALVYPQLLERLTELRNTLDHVCKPASGSGHLDEVSELIAHLVALPEKECFKAWPEAYRAFCKKFEEACRVRFVMEEEYERLRVEFWTRLHRKTPKNLEKMLRENANPTDFADTSKRKNTNFFDLLIEQNRVISVWAGTSHPGNDKIKEHILQNTTKSVATVPEGSGEVHYSNKDQVEKRLFNNDIVEPYAKLLTIQRSLTGNSTYGPDQGVYDKEEAFTNPDYPGNTLGKSRNAIFAEFNNRIAATLKVVASAAHNLKVFQDVYRKALPLARTLAETLQDMYANLCADELEEAESNQDTFKEAYAQLRSWAQSVPEMSGLQERLPYNKRAGRGFQWKGQGYQADHPPTRTAADILLHGLSLLDFDCTDNLRVRIVLENGCPRPAPWGREPFGVAVDWLQLPPASDPSLLHPVQTGSVTYDARKYREELRFHFDVYWKKYDMPVKFDRPYANPPKVVCWLQTIDTERKVGLRVWVQAVDITATGFWLRFTTWDNSTLWEIGAGWLAYPSEGRNDIWTGTYPFSKKKYSSGTKPVAVTFGGEVSFPRPPQVACFLSKLDMSEDAHHRINAHAEQVTKDGMMVHGDSWSDTLLWGADVLCIATSSER